MQQGPLVDRPDARGLGARGHAIVVGLAFALLVPGIFARTLNYHEARYALGAKEMAASGNWLVPTVLGEPRIRKPPATYWAIAASLQTFGTDAEWAVRLPSVLAATMVALLIARMTARWLGETIGLLAGLVQLTSVYVIVQSGLADPDMLLCATVTAALAALCAAIDSPDERPTTATRLGFHVAVALAFLVKGPIGPAFVSLPVAICLAIERYRARTSRLVFDPAGVVVFVIIAAAWPLLVLRRFPDALHEWLTENMGRFEGELGSESPFFYAYTIPLITMPWTPLALRGVWRASRGDAADAPLAILVSWFGFGVVLLSASAGKHDRYAAPILPPVSVFAAIGLSDLVRRFSRRSLAAVIATIWIVTTSIEWLVVPRTRDRYREQARCVRRFDLHMAGAETVYVVGVPYNRRVQLAYYLKGAARAVESPSELRPGSIVVAPYDAIERTEAAGAIITLERCSTSEGDLVLGRIGPP
jgi:4-amino-4-deoxy-L-arabinose transferase-like glycosyltransferase